LSILNDKVNYIKQYFIDNDLFYLEHVHKFPKESIDEVQQVFEEGYFVRHRGSDSQGWCSSTLYGFADYYHTMGPTGYGMVDDETTKWNWTEIAEIAPRTKEFLMDCYDMSKMRRARFMLLEPGGYITAHSDGVNTGAKKHPNGDPYTEENPRRSIMSAINVCLTQPKECYLRRADNLQEIPFEPTKQFFYDNGPKHEARNDSTENRFHFIIHGYHTNKTKEHFIESFERDYGPIELPNSK